MPSVAIIGTRGYPSYYGGFETAVRKLAPYLCDAGWDVAVYGREGAVMPKDPTLDPRVRSVLTRGLDSKSLSTLSFGFTASLDALRTKPDVALVMNVANGYYLPMLRARGIKTVVNVDGIEWDRAKWGRAAKSVFRGGARLAARCADSLVYDSREIERRWRSDFGRTGHFIPYGGERVDQLPIEPGLRHRGYALVVARFVPENTIPEFLEAATTISKQMPVVIVGSSGYGGDLDNRVESLQRDNSNIQWFGHISDDRRLLALWQHAGVYFHGHSVGGTNPTLVQAMALGAPTVARDTPYNREVLGDTGLFVDPNPDAIAEAVLAAALDEPSLEQMSRAAARRAKELYTWESVCGAYESALREQIVAVGASGSRQQGLV
ncbi:glycosyltransferase [Microbacterium sp. NPDC077184]|uniref:glycosyltransferase n=1 Tax=Microbacterium sp. NPDC077184 TaxID=3154764 RepID=UPI00341DFE19